MHRNFRHLRMYHRILILPLIGALALAGCATPTAPTASPTGAINPPPNTPAPTVTPTPTATPPPPAAEGATGSDGPKADVLAVSVSGEAGAYTFSVEVASPDEGCDQYADWWEVVSQDGELLYRRILLHSHVEEQPFTRSGGPVEIEESAVVIVRAHMAPGGYGGQVLAGSVAGGFSTRPGDAGFAAKLAETEPLPDGCAF